MANLNEKISQKMNDLVESAQSYQQKMNINYKSKWLLLILFFVFFAVSFWVQSPFLKIPFLAVAFYCAIIFLSQFNIGNE
jgi:uncharacterized membrane protein YbaN (DUF454 family)